MNSEARDLIIGALISVIVIFAVGYEVVEAQRRQEKEFCINKTGVQEIPLGEINCTQIHQKYPEYYEVTTRNDR